MKARALLPLLLAVSLVVPFGTGCRALKRRAAEKATEKALEESTGAKNVDLSSGGIKVETAQGELPFPAEALRISQRAPAFRLTDQSGQPVDLAALRGSVVVLTAVYASCPHTCPLILAQARDAVRPPQAGSQAHGPASQRAAS